MNFQPGQIVAEFIDGETRFTTVTERHGARVRTETGNWYSQESGQREPDGIGPYRSIRELKPDECVAMCEAEEAMPKQKARKREVAR